MIKIYFDNGTYTTIEGKYKDLEKDLMEAVKVLEDNPKMLKIVSFTNAKQMINLDKIMFIEEESKDENTNK